MHANEVENLSDSIFELNNNINYAKYAKFLMLPLDEAPFEVKANSRKIEVPENFRLHGVGLHGDQIAETLLFRIDRFFDFNDLLTTTIFVQWTRPGSEPESEREGASLITLVDYETEPGKLWLGWPLTSEITQAAGPLKFSLRFFKKDPETKKISYSFNTSTAEVTIKPALHPNINDNLKIDEASSLFHQAVTDSPTSGSTPALRPTFLDYGNLPTQAWVDSNDTLTFAVTSYTGDTGVLTYQWYKASIVGVDEEGNYITENTVEITSSAKTELRPTKDTSRDNKKAYFTKGATNEGDPFTGDIIAGELDLQVVGVSKTTGEVVYERYSTYSVPASPEEIVGLYYVIATNRAGTSTDKQKSAYCEVPRPKTLVFETKNALPEKAFIDDKGAVALTAIATPDDAAHASITYQWLKTKDLEQELTEVKRVKVDADGNPVVDAEDNPVMEPISIGSTLPLAAPDTEKGEALDNHIGWYKVIATNVVNRQPMSVESATYCKVTGHPAKPSIISPTTEQTIELVKGKDDTNGIFTLNIQLTDMHGSLYNESYTYNWFHSITEGDPVAVKVGDADIVSEDVNTGSLQVKLLDKDEVEFYYCEVSNNLNGETSLPVTTGLFKVLAQ